jgi:serine/threonine protein kinase
VCFVGSDVADDLFQISLSDGDCCPEFDRWLKVRENGIRVDFRRIVRNDSFHGDLRESIFDLTVYQAGSVIFGSDGSSSQIYHRVSDGLMIVVKSVHLRSLPEICQINREIENLSNLRHPLIASPLGFIYRPGPGRLCEFTTTRLYASGGSLADIFSTAPVWWTPTMKAKTVAGIALCLRFAHGFGLLHGSLKASNVLFDADHRVEIADFNLIGLEGSDGSGFSGEGWSPSADVAAFAALLFEIVVGAPPPETSAENGEVTLPPWIPSFVSEIINEGFSRVSTKQLSFIDIFERLRANDFEIVSDVDSDDVSGFVGWVESGEERGNWD